MITKYVHFILIVLLLIVSCDTLEGSKKPDNLIDEATMEEILYEATMMQIMDNFSQKNPDFISILGAPYLYLKHGIDSTQLVESEAYYTKNPRIYYSIYSRVLNRMQREKDSLEDLFNGNNNNQKAKAVF